MNDKTIRVEYDGTVFLLGGINDVHEGDDRVHFVESREVDGEVQQRVVASYPLNATAWSIQEFRQ